MNNLLSIKKTLLYFILPIFLFFIILIAYPNLTLRNLNYFNVAIDTQTNNLDYEAENLIFTSENNVPDLNGIIENIKNISISLNEQNYSNKTFSLYNPTNQKKFNLTFPASEFSTYSISYDKNNLELTFSTPDEIIYINDERTVKNGSVIYKIVDIYAEDILKLNDRYIYISDIIHNKNSNIPKSYFENNYQLEKIDFEKYNLFQNDNFDFTGGVWQSEISDCSIDRSGIPQFSQVIKNKFENPYLELISKNHLACVTKRFTLNQEGSKSVKYLLKVNYRYPEGHNSAVYVKFIDQNQIKIFDEIGNIQTIIPEISFSLSLPFIDNDWNSYVKVFEPNLSSVNWVDIYLYSQSFGIENIAQFDEISLFEVKSIIPIEIVKLDNSEILSLPIELNYGRNEIGYKYNVSNIISNDNYSFEQGNWQNELIDCSNQDLGAANFDLKISGDSTVGLNSTELTSSNHYGCIYRKFTPVFDETEVFELSFDYKIVEGSSMMYLIKVNLDNSTITRSNIVDFEKNKWNSEKIQLNSSINKIQNVEIYLYAPSKGELSKVLYDNIKIYPIYEKTYKQLLFSYSNPNLTKLRPIQVKTNFFSHQVSLNGNTLFKSLEYIPSVNFSKKVVHFKSNNWNYYIVQETNQIFIYSKKFTYASYFLIFYYTLLLIYIFRYFIFYRTKKTLESILAKTFFKISPQSRLRFLIAIIFILILFLNLKLGIIFLIFLVVKYLKCKYYYIRWTIIINLVIIAGCIVFQIPFYEEIAQITFALMIFSFFY
jgi:hypothetical protein